MQQEAEDGESEGTTMEDAQISAWVEEATKPVDLPVYNDNFMWCVGCEASVKQTCKTHGAPLRIKDRKILSRARATVPHMMGVKLLDYRASGNHEVGIFARKLIQKNSMFGPYEAPLSAQQKDQWRENNGLNLVLINRDGTTQLYNSSDENQCNWMILVRPACTPETLNTVAFQHHAHIFFITTKTLSPGDELRVWYTEDYGVAIGANTLSAKIQESRPLEREDSQELNDFDEEDTEENSAGPVTDAVGDDALFGEAENSTTDETGADISTKEEYHDASKVVNFTVEESKTKVELPVDVGVAPVSEEFTEKLASPLMPSVGEEGSQDNTAGDSAEEPPHPKVAEGGRRTRSKRKGRPVKVTAGSKKAKVKVKADRGPAPPEGAVATRTSKRRGRGRPPKNRFLEPEEEPVVILDKKKRPNRGARLEEMTAKVKRSKDEVKEERRPREFKVVPSVKREKKVCTGCNREFRTWQQLMFHQRTEHAGEKLYQCDKCEKAFTSKFKLQRHVLIHSDKRPLKCPYCSRGFSRRDHMKQHVKVHDPHKEKFTCDKCMREYASMFALKVHMGFHAVEDGELTCLVCKEEFSKQQDIVHHLKVHMGARSVKSEADRKCSCPYCGKKFFQEKDVRRHLVVHSRDREYLCQFCPQRFGRKDHLTRHIQRSHPTEEQPETKSLNRIIPVEFSKGRQREKPAQDVSDLLKYVNTIPTDPVLQSVSPPTGTCARVNASIVEVGATPGVMAPISQQAEGQEFTVGLVSQPTMDHDYQQMGQVVLASVQNTASADNLGQMGQAAMDNTGASQAVETSGGMAKIQGIEQQTAQVPYTIAPLLAAQGMPVIVGTAPTTAQDQQTFTQMAAGLVVPRPDHQYSVSRASGDRSTMNMALNMLASQVAQDQISYSDALRVLGSMPGVTQITVTPIGGEQEVGSSQQQQPEQQAALFSPTFQAPQQ